GTKWHREPAYGEKKYHAGRHVYKEVRNGKTWIAECAYVNGRLGPADYCAGSADLYGDWDPRHAYKDPGGPQWLGPVNFSYLPPAPIPPVTIAQSQTNGVSQSSDPNELVGPAGYSLANYLRSDGLF